MKWIPATCSVFTGRLQINCDPDQDKMFTEDERKKTDRHTD